MGSLAFKYFDLFPGRNSYCCRSCLLTTEGTEVSQSNLVCKHCLSSYFKEYLAGNLKYNKTMFFSRK